MTRRSTSRTCKRCGRASAAELSCVWSATGSSRGGPFCVNMESVASTERAADLVFLLSQAAHALQTELTAELNELGVTPRMHCVLYHAQDGAFTQIQLADRCALDKTTMVV